MPLTSFKCQSWRVLFYGDDLIRVTGDPVGDDLPLLKLLLKTLTMSAKQPAAFSNINTGLFVGTFLPVIVLVPLIGTHPLVFQLLLMLIATIDTAFMLISGLLKYAWMPNFNPVMGVWHSG